MIVRSILTDPEGTLRNFDFFNDTDDTKLWLWSLNLKIANNIAEQLIEANRLWELDNLPDSPEKIKLGQRIECLKQKLDELRKDPGVIEALERARNHGA